MTNSCKINPHMIVTIDGPSASGKSTIAKMVAEELKFEHLDTGAIYRAIALWCKNHGWNEQDEETFIPKLGEIEYEVVLQGDQRLHKLDGKVVNNDIRTAEISQLSSKLAVIQEVRDVATRFQRKIAESKNCLVEGRDAGTHVFPNAQAKIYLTASKEERARRRMLELKKKYPDKEDQLTLEETMNELSERDERDRKRKNSPMKRAFDAVCIDTTGKSIKQVVRETVQVVKKRKAKKPGFFWRHIVGEERAHTSFVYKMVYAFSWFIYRLLYRLKIYGIENFPVGSDRATIVAPNHVSYLDPPAVGLACPCEMHALAIDYLFKAPVIKFFLPRLNVHPVSNDVGDAKVLRMIVSLLKQGKNVVIFPEGSRSLDNKLLPFKRGVGALASLTKCSVTPTYIDGAHEAWGRSKKLPKLWGKISVVFGKPLFWMDYEKKYPSRREAEQAFTNDLKDAIQTIKDNFKR